MLDTDYESYTVTYNCVQRLALREETAFILTRDPNPAQEVVSIVQGLAKRWSPGCVNAADKASQKW